MGYFSCRLTSNWFKWASPNLCFHFPSNVFSLWFEIDLHAVPPCYSFFAHLWVHLWPHIPPSNLEAPVTIELNQSWLFVSKIHLLQFIPEKKHFFGPSFVGSHFSHWSHSYPSWIYQSWHHQWPLISIECNVWLEMILTFARLSLASQNQVQLSNNSVPITPHHNTHTMRTVYERTKKFATIFTWWCSSWWFNHFAGSTATSFSFANHF